MLSIDLQQFGQVAGWSNIPKEFLQGHTVSSCSERSFPGGILPCDAGNGSIVWYAVSESAQEWRQLGRLLYAYVGPTVSNFTGALITLDEKRPLEKTLIDAGITYAAKISVPEDLVALAGRALDRLVLTYRARPQGDGELPVSTQGMLAQLEMAIAAGDLGVATGLIDRLRSDWRLDALNLRFLEVRVAATFRNWSAITGASWFPELCLVRKPPAVASAMLDALYHVYLEPHHEDAGRLTAVFDASVRTFATPLVRHVPADFPSRKPFDRFFPTEKRSVPGGSVQNVQDKLLSALETSALTERKDALESFRVLPTSVQAEVLERPVVRAAFNSLAPEVPVQVPPSDWTEWVARLADPSNLHSFDWAVAGASEWPVSAWLDPARAKALATSLLSVDEGLAQQRLAMALPSLMRWVKSDAEYPRASLKAVYEALYFQLQMFETRSHVDREVGSDLLDALLSLGCSEKTYGQLLEDSIGLVDPGAGHLTVYWCFELADIVLRHPCPSLAHRTQLLSRILSSVHASLSVLSAGQRRTYGKLASIAGWPPLQSAPVELESLTVETILAGKTVAIYTLNESAGRNAEEILLGMAPKARVELAHDHVGSARLERLAKNADYFVIVSGCAKHAAYDCIMRHRAGKPVLYASGKGFCSIVRAIEDAFAPG